MEFDFSNIRGDFDRAQTGDNQDQIIDRLIRERIAELANRSFGIYYQSLPESWEEKIIQPEYIDDN